MSGNLVYLRFSDDTMHIFAITEERKETYAQTLRGKSLGMLSKVHPWGSGVPGMRKHEGSTGELRKRCRPIMNLFMSHV